MKSFDVCVGNNGELLFPEEFRLRYGLNPGARIRVDETAKGPRFRLPLTHLNKLYVEPTNRCNLDCRTCMRNAWNESLGFMSEETFSRIIRGLRDLPAPPMVFFGGLGEPLFHPEIVGMVAQAKSLNCSVELITNGTLLTAEISDKLIKAGLDRLWVSLDGATSESYSDIRLGALFPDVLNSLKAFHNARLYNPSNPSSPSFHGKPELGIVFVAMKRNIQDLPAILSLAKRLGAGTVLVSNVLPYSEEMGKEVLYSRSITDVLYQSSAFRLELPKIDIDETTRKSLYESVRAGHSLSLAGGRLGESNDYCPFVENGAAAISWDGNLSPCLALLHTHKNYFGKTERICRRYTVGNLNEHRIKQLWDSPEYMSFRERVQTFDFSPCTYCSGAVGGCSLFEENEKDCLGGSFPTCGGCLWAQGIIQCP
jgi:MoaA/NifB/PqqE/SkfB family radical SAM enzyme